MTLNTLYRQVIMKHHKAQHGFSPLPEGAPFSERENPACGDHFRLVVDSENQCITALHIEGQGCAISTAACSAMTQAITGKSIEEARALAHRFREALTQRDTIMDEDQWGELAAFDSVKQYRSRVTCASLCWDLLLDALNQQYTGETS
jgi:nitrogen fixation NifU-like protein